MKINCCILIFAFLVISAVPVSSNTFIVGDSETGYTSIQDAVNDAKDGDIIQVCNGSYSENIFVNKSLTIRAACEDQDDTIVRAKNIGDATFYINSNGVNLTGFTIKGEKSDKSGFDDENAGIYLDNVQGCEIKNNVLSGHSNGIILNNSSDTIISDNVLFLNDLHGIYIINSKNNVLLNNEVSSNKYGIYLESSDNNRLSGNNASHNNNYGIALLKSARNMLENNLASGNKYGICLTSSFENELHDNVASRNGLHGIYFWRSSANNLKSNSLFFNGHSGISLFGSSNNNSFNGNNATSNNNGMRLEFNCGNNSIINNTLNSNHEYGLYIIDSSNNTVLENVLLDNQKGIEINDIGTKRTSINQIHDNEIDDRFNYQLPITGILILFVIGIAFYLKQKSLLKKALFASSISIILFVVILLIIYYPTLFNWPGSNVYIEDLEWTNVTKINDTTYRTTLSMNITYLYKDAYSNRFRNDESTDEIPVIVQVKTDYPMYGYHPEEDYTLSSEEKINLQHLQSYPYECTFDLDSGKDYFVVVIVQWKRYLDSPHPYYGEWNFEDFGGLSTDINLSTL
ncbi:MAG: right-handed parallel beta-helix repeat-containing protein [Methanosarcinaceae archaeon]|nr:right-handed parallel beta-helix repeat-containing protein [Methanosarcinaceae archaeon]